MTAALIAYGVAATALLAWVIVHGEPLRCQWQARASEQMSLRLHGARAKITSLTASLNDAHATETRLRQELALAAAKLHEAHALTEWPTS